MAEKHDRTIEAAFAIFVRSIFKKCRDELYPFFPDFAKNHKVIFYDQRGNGKSIMEKFDSSNLTVDLIVKILKN